MNILLLLIISFSTVNNPEPEFGYWICDAIRQEKKVDMVILPKSIFTDSLTYRTEDLIMSAITINELNQLLTKNLFLPNFLPIAGFTVIIDSLGKFTAIPNQTKEKYWLITTKSIYYPEKASALNQTISEIIIAYLQKINHISFPETHRYLFLSFCLSSGNINYQPTIARININTASQQELETLPGIGPKTAQKIIEYRQINGPFKSIEDIKNVSGIGPKKYEQIKNLIRI